MKKVFLLMICMTTVLLVGCFNKKAEPTPQTQPQPPVVVDDVVDTNDDIEDNDDNDIEDNDIKDNDVEDNDIEDNDDDTHEDELDENGEFDPKKFEDEDIDEIMNLMKELIEE